MPGAPVIKSGLNTFEPMYFATTPTGGVIGTNGVDRGIIWDGRAAAVYDLGIEAPTAKPTVGNSGGGHATAGAYLFGYRYIDAQGIGSNLSPLTSVTASDNDQFSWSGLVASTNTRVAQIELYRTTSAESETIYRVAVINNGVTSFSGELLTDTQLASEPTATAGVTGDITSSTSSSGKVQITLAASSPLYVGAVIAIQNHSVDAYNQETHTITYVSGTTIRTDKAYIADGTGGQWVLQNLPLVLDATNQDYAYRFSVPPDFKKVPIYFQDRLWLGIDVEYSAGTISTIGGSNTITGVDTNWPSNFPGRYIYPAGDIVGYKILQVTDDETLVVEGPVTGTLTNVAYSINPPPAYEDQFFFSETQEPESMRLTNVITVQRRTGDCDRWTAMRDSGPVLYLFKQRSVYRVTYVAQPNLDASVLFAGNRGAINAKCVTTAEGSLYTMDFSGPYRIANGSLDTDIGTKVQDHFRDGLIDMAQASNFHVAADPIEGTVRFFIAYVGDDDVRRALVYNYRLDAWWEEEYPWELSGTCIAPLDDRFRRMCAGTDDAVFLMDEGFLDGTTLLDGAETGTIVSATSGAAVLSTSCPSDCNGAPITIISGSAKGAVGYLDVASGGEGTTSITLADDWSTATPAAGDVYLIGAIPWEMTTGILPLDTAGTRTPRQTSVVFQPTTASTYMYANVYLNHDIAPQENVAAPVTGSGVRYVEGSADIQIDMRSSRPDTFPANAVAPGYEVFGLGGVGEPSSQPDRFVTYDLYGWQGNSPVVLFGLVFDGLDPGGV